MLSLETVAKETDLVDYDVTIKVNLDFKYLSENVNRSKSYAIYFIEFA